jgi:arylsulfatase A-like enzyme
LKRPNVLLVILESARADLLDAEVDGVPVMPTLRSLPGQRIALFSQGGYTIPSVIAALTGSMATAGISLVDRFHAMNYRTGVFSAQDEDFGGIAARCHLRSADVFVDTKSFPPQLRMYSNTAPGGSDMPAGLVTAKFAEWCCKTVDSRPFFAYVNLQEMHFPYYYDGAPKILTNQPVRRGQMRAENQKGILRTYMNAARLADNGLAAIVSALDQIGARSNTVLMVMGDHGQEIFDHGILGHGTTIDYEQVQTLGKLCNSDWVAPAAPVGEVEIIDILHNAMARSPRDIQPLLGKVLCYMGAIETPEQIGLFTASGLIKYNFKTDAWTRQASFGAELVPGRPEFPLIWWWESALIERAAGKL